MVKVKVHVSGRPIGWLRAVNTGLDTEVLVCPSAARASRFDESMPADRQAMALYMSQFIGPERPTVKSLEPVVTFQLVKV